MEIERKYFVKDMPEDLSIYDCYKIEQAYLSIDPVVRIRRENDDFYMTYKGKGFMTRAESNMPLTIESYYHLLAKADGNVITKRRYKIPIDKPSFSGNIPTPPPAYKLYAELDIFEGIFDGLKYVEVEFGSVEAANSFIAPEWFGEDITFRKEFHNSHLSTAGPEEISRLIQLNN